MQGTVPSEVSTLDFLLELKGRLTSSKSEEEVFLLENFDFYLFPFLNLDGIIFGNHSFNLAGKSLIEKLSHSKHNIPEIYYLCKELKNISNNQ